MRHGSEGGRAIPKAGQPGYNKETPEEAKMASRQLLKQIKEKYGEK